MKNHINLFTCFILIVAFLSYSCSKDEGPQGEQGVAGQDGLDGINGADGVDGISCWDLNGNGIGDTDEDTNSDGNFDALDCQGKDGVDGNNGVDGNFNVKRYDVLITDLSGTFATVPLDALSNADLDNSAVFLYVTKGAFTYPVPGPGPLNEFYIRAYFNDQVGSISLNFYDYDNDASYAIEAGDLEELIVVIAETTVSSKGNKENIYSELKSVGVDTADYHALMDYFELDY